MATIDLGKIKLVNRGTWASGTTYTADDIVQYTDGNVTSTYICVVSSSQGHTPSSSGTTHASWDFLAKGQDALPSQSGQSGKFLTTNGSALSFGTVEQKLIGIGGVRHTSSTSFNNSSTNMNSQNTFYYPNTANAMLEVDYNRQNASSNIIAQGHYTVDTSTNMHSFWVFVADSSTGLSVNPAIAKNLGFDEHQYSRNYMTVSFNTMFTAAELGSFTGTRRYIAGGGAGNSRTHTGTRCPNTHGSYGDTSNASMYSELVIMEVLP
jgi:hypothetical protein